MASIILQKYRTAFLVFISSLLIIQMSVYAQLQCPTSPADFNLITPCYVNGSRAANPNEDVLVLFNHATARGESATKQVIADYSEVGSIWGLAYNPHTKKLYAAAFLKRHCDISPDGLGAIYEIDLTTPTTAGAGTPTLWMDLNTTTHLGAGATLFPTETAANRGLAGINAPSRDEWAYNRVGKEGLGDIEISTDGTKMYVMDLTNRQVLEINMATKTVTNRYAVNAPANYVNAADRRPFGIKYYNDELYIGVISSGETGEVDANLRGTIMKLSGSTFTSVLDMPTWNYRDCCSDPRYVGWNNYTTSDLANGYPDNNAYSFIQYPVPLISDIEFDNVGNMVIGVMDWSAHRFGSFNYRPFPTPTSQTSLYNIQTHGDVIKANKSGSSWVLESDIGNFYNDMRAVPQQGNTWPIETFMGGLVVTDCNGTDLVAANMQDPFGLNSGGVVWMKTSNGLMQTNSASTPANNQSSGDAQTIIDGSRLRIYVSDLDQPSTFGKAAGLGDIVGTYEITNTCTKPTLGANVTTNTGTCNGTTPNNDATASLTVTGGDKADIVEAATYGTGPAYGAGTNKTVTAGSVSFTGLKHNTQYTIRVWNADNTCFEDKTFTTASITCNPTCTPPNAGADVTICLPKTTLDLTDAPSGTTWSVGVGNPAAATINATTGVISGLTIVGTYKFVLSNTADANCKDEMQVIVTNGDAPIALCDNGSTSYTLTAPANLTNVIWYNMAGTQVGTGTSLTVSSTTTGLSDGSEAFYFIGQDGVSSGCDVQLCCPVKFITQTCCTTPNCGTVSVIKN